MHFVLIALALMLVGGCATVTNSLSPQDMAQIRIERVEVTVKPDANISWPRAEQEFAERQVAESPTRPKRASFQDTSENRGPFGTGANAMSVNSGYEAAVNSPEGKAYVREKLVALVNERMKLHIVPMFQGTRGAVLHIEIVGFIIPHAVQRVVLGGSPIFGGLATLKDAQTGAVLARMDRGTAAAAGNGLVGVLVDQALPDLEDRLMVAYVEQVHSWLLRK